MATATLTAERWEKAWEEYVEALERWEEQKLNLYRPRHIREAKKSRRRFCQAKEALRVLDSEFCDRMGI